VINFLEPLSRLPGVEQVLLISHDGVPIAYAGGRSSDPAGKEDALAALAASWLNELTQAVAPLSWSAPERVCLRGARGTLVLRRSESACLLALLTRDATPEDVRLSMDGTLARIERARLSRSGASAAASAGQRPEAARPAPTSDLPGPIPLRTDPFPVEEGNHPASQ